MPSSFNSAEPFSAFWQYIDGPVADTCATQGRTFINSLQAALRTGGGPGVWKDEVQAALVEKAREFRSAYPNQGWESVHAQILADQTARRIGGMSLVFAIYITYYLSAGRRLDAIRVAPNTVLPVWGVAVPNDAGPSAGSLVCYAPATDIPPLSMSRAQILAAAAESTTGIRVGTGRPVPPAPGVADPGVGAGFGPWGIAAAALAIIGTGYLVTRSRRN